MAFIKRIPSPADPVPTSAEVIKQAMAEKWEEYTRLMHSQDPVENKMAEAVRAELDRLDRLLAQATQGQPITGGGKPLQPMGQQTGGGMLLPPSAPQTGGFMPLPPPTSPVRKLPRYVVRVSNAWKQAQAAAGRNPDDEIRKRIPAGANFTIQSI